MLTRKTYCCEAGWVRFEDSFLEAERPRISNACSLPEETELKICRVE